MSKNGEKFRMILGVVMIGVVMALGVMAFAFHRTEDAVNEAHRALCAQEKTLAEEIQANTHFLQLHPEGIPSAHLGRAIFLKTIAQEKLDFSSYKDVTCS